MHAVSLEANKTASSFFSALTKQTIAQLIIMVDMNEISDASLAPCIQKAEGLSCKRQLLVNLMILLAGISSVYTKSYQVWFKELT